ncbi:unnamed protein product [Schistosoma turkestanicum]|nr:unnamed protein product [Schistosoma turkestanicum]
MSVKESIFNLIPFEEPPKPTLPRYKSCSLREAKSSFSNKQYPCKTMGLAKVTPPNPQNFLKTSHSVPKLCRKKEEPSKISYYKCSLSAKKEPLPAVKSGDMNIVSQKDFIKNNRHMADASVPPKPKTFVVDTRTGHKFDIKYSGLQPFYVKRKSFGGVPKYLTEREKAASEAQKNYEEHIKKLEEENALKIITESEKKSLLDQLKNKWQKRFKQYQSLALVIDTPPKVHQKLWLEKEMKEIEKNIEFLEEYHYIYVAK